MILKHDTVIKDLMSNRKFATAFLQQYMPKELSSQVNWQSVKLDTANVEHTRAQHKDNYKLKEVSDLAFLFKFSNQSQGACFVHIEAQTTNDQTLVLRTRHYQTSYLLDYLKRNSKVKKLPLVVSILYYANKKPFSHSLNIHDYFDNKELAKKYAFNINLIDLTKLDDQQILQHGYISGFEYILKHIQQKDIDGHLKLVSQQLIAYDNIFQQTLIKYIACYSDLDKKEFRDRIIDYQPILKDTIMTVAQQWQQMGVKQGVEQGVEQGIKQGIEQGIEQGVEQGIKQGIDQGKKQTNQQIIRNMLRNGYTDQQIIKIVGISLKTLESLKKNCHIFLALATMGSMSIISHLYNKSIADFLTSGLRCAYLCVILTSVCPTNCATVYIGTPLITNILQKLFLKSCKQKCLS